MWFNLRSLPAQILKFSARQIESKRTTFILRRTHEVPPDELGTKFPKKLEEKHYIYELVEDTNTKKKPLLSLVLLKDVPGLGMLGEKVEVNPYIGYRDLLLPKLAVYADSPEAQNVFRGTDVFQYSSVYCKIVEHYLERTPVAVILSAENHWVLQPWHIKIALRQHGVLVKNDDSITLPEKKISGPNLEVENKDFIVKLTMNKKEEFYVRCRIFQAAGKSNVLQANSEFDLSTPRPALFPEQQEMINELIKKEKEASKKIIPTTSVKKRRKKYKNLSKRSKH